VKTSRRSLKDKI